MITTIHDAVEAKTGKRDFEGNEKIKPMAVIDYTNKMSGVDTGQVRSNGWVFSVPAQDFVLGKEATFP